MSQRRRQLGRLGFYGGPLLLLLTLANVRYGLGSGAPRTKFYLFPFLKGVLGNPVSQTTWGELGVWSAQDNLLVIISLIALLCGWMLVRKGRLMSLDELLDLTGGKNKFEGGQTRKLRIGMEVKTPGGLTGVIEHINPERVRVRSGQVSVHLDKEELEASLDDED